MSFEGIPHTAVFPSKCVSSCRLSRLDRAYPPAILVLGWNKFSLKAKTRDVRRRSFQNALAEEVSVSRGLGDGLIVWKSFVQNGWRE
jgi:hypothetical protein